jgi:nitrogen fixation protein NifU and related proteins
MTTAALYQELVLEHSRAPRNFGALPSHTHAADGDNPLCGDALHVELRLEDAHIAEIRFRGEACAIVRATASLLSEQALQLGATEIAALEAAFIHVIKGEAVPDNMLADLNALAALARYPSRRKCALLPFSTLRAALAGIASTTTEGPQQ